VLTPAAAPHVYVMSVSVEALEVRSQECTTCLVPQTRQSKRQKYSYKNGIAHQWPRVQISLGKLTRQAYVLHDLNYGLVWQDIWKMRRASLRDFL